MGNKPMGNKPTNTMGNKPIKNKINNTNYCTDDLMCQNINSNKSTPDNIVLTCPNAKCIEGTCNCGDECKRDPYTGMCCKDVEKINNDFYCIENFMSCSDFGSS